MIQVVFKNFQKSESVFHAVHERVEALVTKFSHLQNSKIKVTLEMENSAFQAGPDLFKVKLHVSGGRYDKIIVEKADSNLYAALAELVDHMHEVFNRFGDRERVKNRKKARQITDSQEKQLLEQERKIV